MYVAVCMCVPVLVEAGSNEPETGTEVGGTEDVHCELDNCCQRDGYVQRAFYLTEELNHLDNQHNTHTYNTCRTAVSW